MYLCLLHQRSKNCISGLTPRRGWRANPTCRYLHRTAVGRDHEIASKCLNMAVEFSDKVNIDIHICVGQESDPPLEEGHIYKAIKSLLCPVPSDCGMPVLVGTGNSFWSALYVISSTIGFVIVLALLNIYCIKPCRVLLGLP